MGLSRRSFLISGALLFATPLAAATTAVRYLGAAADRQGGHYLVGLDADGAARFRTPLPGRGHGIAVCPGGGSCVLTARRPERWMLEVSLADGQPLTRGEAAPGRHFYGHGEFDPAGRLFYATENDFDGERGVIGVYDLQAGLRRVGELPSHGIGPHELRLMPDGSALVVANGGILTHPDSGRAKLNLPDMRPNLVIVDRRSGALREKAELPPELHQLSIRHLDVNVEGKVVVAMQYQGPAGDAVPLLALHVPGEGLRPLVVPEPQRRRMRQYCGSVRFDRSGRWFAVSAPRGNRVLFFSAQGDYAGQTELADGCGIAATDEDGEFLLSAGTGVVALYRADTGNLRRFEPLSDGRWDNHLQQF